MTWRLAMKWSGQKLEALSPNWYITPHGSYTKHSLTVRGDKVGTEKLTNLKVNVLMTDK